MSTVEYPHPVLQPEGHDYNEGCSFSLIINEDELRIEDDEVIITARYSLECSGIEEMIADGRARVGVLINSPQASFRRSRYFDGTDKCVIKANKYEVIAKIEIQCFVLANQDLKRFALPDFNQLLFEGASFNINKGDILAISAKNTIYLDSSELEKPLTSIFLINQRDSQENPIQPDFQDDTGKIAINLSGPLFKSYAGIAKGYAYCAQRCITCSIVLPVLTEAIDLLRHSEEWEFSDQRWARVVLYKLSKAGKDLEDSNESSTMLANELLGDVVGSSLDELVNMLMSADEADENVGGYD